MTLPTLQSWPDFDDDGQPMSETVIGSDITPIAIVLTSEHHDSFLRLALAAPDLLAASEKIDALDAPECQASVNPEIWAAWTALRAAIAKAKGN